MKLRYSVGIATKMIFIVTLIVVSAIGVVVTIASDLFREDSVTRIQETNKDSAVQLAERVTNMFQDATERLTLLAQFATRSSSVEEAQRAIQNTITNADDIVSFLAYKIDGDGKAELQSVALSEAAVAEYNLDSKKFEMVLTDELLSLQLKSPKDVMLVNSSSHFGVPMFTIAFLSQDASSKVRWWFRSEIRQDRILKLFQGRSEISAFLVDKSGRLMSHSDKSLIPDVISGKSMVSSPIVAKMLEGTTDNHQMSYVDANDEAYFGAFKKAQFSGIGVVTEVPEKKALATIERVQYRSLLVMVVVVCLAFMLNFGFSKSLTANLKKLFEATEKIVDGKFDVKINVNSSDEIGALAKAFTSMSAGLKEREKIKDAFDKFHSKEVAKKLLSGEIKLGGEKKHATIFFSDIRGFTAMSEKMNPDQVVSLLNEYFTAMVKIVYANKGIVDKYIGDAILAVWGVPESSGNDAYNAVKASLQMRDHLKKWNKQRLEKGLFELKIGVGLHSGEVLSGNIGAYERKLEYTVIGDTVNQASRIEGACKAVGSDLLISDATWAVVSSKGIECGPPIELKAKGKSNLLIVHQVIGWKDGEGVLHTSLSAEEIETIKNGFQPVEEKEEAKTTVHSSSVSTGSFSTSSLVAQSREKVEVEARRVDVPSISAETNNEGTREAGKGVTSLVNNNVNGQLESELAVATGHDQNKVEWYVVDDPGSKEYQGPFSLNQILAKLGDGQLTYASAYVFRQGDSQMTPVTQISQLDRRVKNPFANIQLPETIQPETVIRTQATSEEWYVAGTDGKTLGPYSEDELRVALGKGHMTRTTYVWKKGMDKWIHLHEIPDFDRRAS